MLTYDEAITEWGYRRLRQRYPKGQFERDSIAVSYEWDEGYQCCGGNDPYCCCSLAESPYNYVCVTAKRTDLKQPKVATIVDRYVEFDELVRELYAIGAGAE